MADSDQATRLEALLDAEVMAFVTASNAFNAPSSDVGAIRAGYVRMCAHFAPPRGAGVEAGVTRDDDALSGPNGPIAVRRYGPAAARHAAPLVVYYHGGGYVLGGLDSHDGVCAEIAARSALEVVAVDYRLAPEHPHPASAADALAAARALGSGGRPLVLVGDSVGGGLAAATGIGLRDGGGATALGTVLIYPSLGGWAQGADGGALPSYAERAEAPLLRTVELGFFHVLHAGSVEAAERLSRSDPSYAPLAASSFAGLPRSIALAVDVDPLRDDAVAWTERLRAAGVAAEIEVHAGLPHGCLRARRSSRAAARYFDRVIAAITAIARG